MRFWRPMLRNTQAVLAQGLNLEISQDDGLSAFRDKKKKAEQRRAANAASLSDLVTVAASATPSTIAASSTSSASADGVSSSVGLVSSMSLGLGFRSEFVPKAGRTYMCTEAELERPTDATSAAAAAAAAGGSADGGEQRAADWMAATTLALQIAASYQTPHSYVGSHPLHKGKYKSGGKREKSSSIVKVEPSKRASKKQPVLVKLEY